jgi:hypothetical protein
MDDLEVTADGAKKVAKQTVFESGKIKQGTETVGGDGGLKAFLLKIAHIPVKDPQVISRPKTGSEISPLQARDPFIAKRSPSGEVQLMLDGDPDKLKKRYQGFFLVDSNKREVLSAGRLEGNTVTFPDSANFRENTLIVLQPKSIIGTGTLGSLEQRVLGSSVVQSLCQRSKFCSLGAALQAAGTKQEQDAANEKAKAS